MSKNTTLKRQANVGGISLDTSDEDDANKNEENTKNTSKNPNRSTEKLDEQKTLELFEMVQAYRKAVVASTVFLLAIVIILLITLLGERSEVVETRHPKFPVVHTSCGRVEGLMDDSSFSFRGIPFARQPIGDLRFRYSQPLDSLEYCWNDTLIAHNQTDFCLQILGNGTIVGKEDCLTLDVITPHIRYDNPLPVIVLIGAESLIGGSPGKLRPSLRYARSKDVVFVRPNFRMGVLGFLALDILSESDYPKTSGNYGLSDILVALKWVQHNIEHFGGNKKSVTLLGHGAGGTLVTALTTISGPHKYFARAWASSGSAIYPNKDLKTYQTDNLSFLDAVHCKDVECLRTMDAMKLVSAVQDTWRKPLLDLPSADDISENRHHWLILDGRVLKSDPLEIWSRNKPMPVSLIIGTTMHSGSSEKLLMKHQNWTEELVKEHVVQSFLSKRFLEDIWKFYKPTYKDLSKLISDIRIVCPLFNMLNQIKTIPFYVVTQPRFQGDLADINADIDTLLGRYEPITPEQRRYFSSLQGLFYRYVWNGDVDESLLDRKVIVVEQDLYPSSSYSHCDYWIKNNVVPKYAALD